MKAFCLSKKCYDVLNINYKNRVRWIRMNEDEAVLYWRSPVEHSEHKGYYQVKSDLRFGTNEFEPPPPSKQEVKNSEVNVFSNNMLLSKNKLLCRVKIALLMSIPITIYIVYKWFAN